ncbi:MAG: DUF4345 domain-containing protein [Gammaproteobacteria bacterium]|nr:DUF4345 domain-containing protein [Gammaproteobacteria bacterium]
MKNSKVLKVILFISGLIATGVGAAILIMPVAFYATYDIELVGNTSLLNEIRAPGGSLLASGALIMLGAFVAKLTFTSAVVSTLLYLSYGLSRILSIGIDGIPAEGLVHAVVLEIIVGLVCVFALLKYQEKQREHT